MARKLKEPIKLGPLGFGDSYAVELEVSQLDIYMLLRFFTMLSEKVQTVELEGSNKARLVYGVLADRLFRISKKAEKQVKKVYSLHLERTCAHFVYELLQRADAGTIAGAEAQVKYFLGLRQRVLKSMEDQLQIAVAEADVEVA